ncbi:MAG: TrkA C-terminal domain-containing protein [Desulfurococcales archaeon]|jgi:Trk K+ transport system NAD-binding subunit
MTDILSNNGYIVHIFTNDEKDAKRYLEKPVYIHILKEEGIGEDLEKNIDEVEVAFLISFDEKLNLSLGKILKSRGVPMVVVMVRSSDAEILAQEGGMIPVIIAKNVIGELISIPKLRFSKFIPIDGALGLLTLSITSDSKLLGKPLSEIEDKYMVKALILREGRYIRDPDSIVQEGDIIVMVGRSEDLRELASQ